MRRIWVLSLIGLIAGGTTQAQTGDHRPTIQRYKHTTWSVDDGAPVGIQALAQSSDGFIWVGASDGVYRFDGVTFEHLLKPAPLQARANSVTALLPVPNGDMWVGYNWGGVALYHDGKPIDINYPAPTGSVDRIVQDTNGAIWVTSDGRQAKVHRFTHGKWTSSLDNWGLGTELLYGPAVGAAGEIVFATQGRMFVMRRGDSRFERTVNAIGVSDVGFALSQKGQIWTIDQHGLARVPLEANNFQYAKTSGSFSTGGSVQQRSLLFDRSGNLWGDSGEGGVFRIHNPQSEQNGISINRSAQWFSSLNGLTSNAVNAIVEDREENIWIATTAGLDRLSRANITFEDQVEVGINNPIMSRSDGDISVISNNKLYIVDSDNSLRVVGKVDQSVYGGTLCPHKGGGGWFAESNLIHRFSRDGVVETVEGPFPHWASVHGCVEDAQGFIWVSVSKTGTYFYDRKKWTHFLPSGQPANAWPWLMTTDSRGRVVMYFGRSTVVRVEAGRSEVLLDASANRFGLINAMTRSGDGLLLASDFGIVNIHDGRVSMLDGGTYPFLSQASGIAETSTGWTWLSTSTGLVRIASQDLSAAFAQPGRALPFRLFDYHDGLPGPPAEEGYLNLVEGPDGRVWFLGARGLAWIDPAKLSQNTVPPPVLIRSVTADGVTRSTKSAITLPKGTARLQIDYTALSFVSPDRVKFRYKLEGFDRHWIDPGTRRQAFYTNLSPGTYRFRIIAANDDGVWNENGASVDLELPPTFVQSKLFVVLCVFTLALVLWFVYSIRMRQLASKIRDHLQERLTERERIARELHDTLLQGVQGLILRLQSIANQIPPEQPAHGLMEQALDRAEDVLVDGRDRVRDLRVDDAPVDLARRLGTAGAAAAEQFAADHVTEFRLFTDGTIRSLHPIVREEAERIGREAILNAFRHARAHAITVRVAYRQSALKIDISDDGVGMPADIAAGGRRDGHYGMPGMRERAARIQGSLTVAGAPGEGSRISLSVPAGVAYRVRSVGREAYLRLTRSARH